MFSIKISIEVFTLVEHDKVQKNVFYVLVQTSDILKIPYKAINFDSKWDSNIFLGFYRLGFIQRRPNQKLEKFPAVVCWRTSPFDPRFEIRMI